MQRTPGDNLEYFHSFLHQVHSLHTCAISVDSEKLNKCLNYSPTKCFGQSLLESREKLNIPLTEGS